MSVFREAKKYGMFFTGIICAALGISLITQAGLGTSPITSPAYVLTFIFPDFSLGTFTFAMNTTMFLLEALILGKTFKKIQLLQLPATFVFSTFIDLWRALLFTPDYYIGKLSMLIAGCICLGLGVSLEVIPDVLMLPGEGLVKAIAWKKHWDFGTVKTSFDLSLVTIAVAVSLIASGQVNGLREGTLIAALTVGSISKFFIQNIQTLLHHFIAMQSVSIPAKEDSEQI